MSLETSMKVIRLCFPETIVTGPFISVNVCRVKFLTRHFSNVDLPTLGGPTIAITIGGGSTGYVRKQVTSLD